MPGKTSSSQSSALLSSQTTGFHGSMPEPSRRNSISTTMLLATQLPPIITSQKPYSTQRLHGR